MSFSPAKEESHWDAPLQRCGWAGQDWANCCCTNTHLAMTLKHHWGTRGKNLVKESSPVASFTFPFWISTLYFKLWLVQSTCIVLFTLLLTDLPPLPTPFLWLHWWFHILMYRKNTHWGNICKTHFTCIVKRWDIIFICIVQWVGNYYGFISERVIKKTKNILIVRFGCKHRFGNKLLEVQWQHIQVTQHTDAHTMFL